MRATNPLGSGGAGLLVFWQLQKRGQRVSAGHPIANMDSDDGMFYIHFKVFSLLLTYRLQSLCRLIFRQFLTTSTRESSLKL
jgi:hypothetical protein